MPPRGDILARTLARRRPCINCVLRPATTNPLLFFSTPSNTHLSHSPSIPQIQHRQQRRPISVLSTLSDVPSSYKKRIRRGRGPSSGKGKTSGRGHKGQKQHGKVPAAFQGGQTPLEIAKGIRGFKNRFALNLSVVNVDKLQNWIDAGRIDNSKPITPKELHESRLAHSVRDGIKLLARDANTLRSPVHITVSRASKAAIAAVERVGGTVQTRYYTKTAIKRIIKGQMHPTQSIMSAAAPQKNQPLTTRDEGASDEQAPSIKPLPIQDPYKPRSEYRYRLPDAFSRKDIEYYRDKACRGYLSYQVADGHSPSLFYKAPPKQLMSVEERLKLRKKKVKSETTRDEPKMW